MIQAHPDVNYGLLRARDAALQFGKGELLRLDAALRRAEDRLTAAHAECSATGCKRAVEIYPEIVGLRGQTRSVLASMGEVWVSESAESAPRQQECRARP